MYYLALQESGRVSYKDYYAPLGYQKGLILMLSILNASGIISQQHQRCLNIGIITTNQ
jgi:hypothetical protein